MKFNLPKFFLQKPDAALRDTEFRHTSALRLLTLLIIGLLVFALGATAFFVYRSVTSSIGQIQSIILLQSELYIEPIDFDAFNKGRSAWNIKHATTTMMIARDPFNAANEATSSESIANSQ